MHAIKETLLQCASAMSSYSSACAAEEAAVEKSGFKRDPAGRALARFPVIPELDAKVTAFLIPARRCVTEICQLAGYFFELKQLHSNAEHLLVKELVPQLGKDNPLVRFVESYLPLTAATMLQGNEINRGGDAGPQLLHGADRSDKPDRGLMATIGFA